MGVSRGCPNFFGYPLWSQERVKLRTSNCVGTFIGSLGTKVHKNFGNSSRGRSQGVRKIFSAPKYRAHCMVTFATAQLSHEVPHWLDISKFTRLRAVFGRQHGSCYIILVGIPGILKIYFIYLLLIYSLTIYLLVVNLMLFIQLTSFLLTFVSRKMFNK